MSWQELEGDAALSEGAALWVVGDLDSSKWAQKINWYLNFQFKRAQLHKPREISRELASVMQVCEFEAPEVELSSRSPLLIDSSKLLPNLMTVQIVEKTPRSWMEEAKQVWMKLNKPSVRLFLPSGFSAKDVPQDWAASALEGSFVRD